MDNSFAEIKKRVSFDDVLEHRGLHKQRNGKHICPFHMEQTGSFSIKDNRARCFGCGWSGTVLDYYAESEGVSILEAAKMLNEEFKLGFFQDKPVIDAERKQIADAARQRGADNEIVDAFKEWLEIAGYVLADTLFWLRKMVDRTRPESPDEDMTDYTFWLKERDRVEGILDMYEEVTGRAYTDELLKQKFDFFTEYREGVRQLAQFRNSRKTAIGTYPGCFGI